VADRVARPTPHQRPSDLHPQPTPAKTTHQIQTRVTSSSWRYRLQTAASSTIASQRQPTCRQSGGSKTLSIITPPIIGHRPQSLHFSSATGYFSLSVLYSGVSVAQITDRDGYILNDHTSTYLISCYQMD
jgi:hypothetical protein